MNIPRGLLLQIKCLKILGLFPVEFDGSELNLICKSPQRHACGLALATSCFVMLFATLFCLFDSIYNTAPSHYNKTGMTFELIATQIAGFCQITVNLCLYFGSVHSFRIIVNVIKFENKYIWKKTDNDITLCLFRWYLGICVLCALNMIYLYIIVGNWRLMLFFQAMTYLLQMIFSGLIAVYYTSLVVILNRIMECINAQITRNILMVQCNSNGRCLLKQVLNDRSEIIKLCESDISEFYGVPVICILACVVINAPVGPYFGLSLLEVSDVMDFHKVLLFFISTNFIWFFQFMFIAVMILYLDVNKVANETTRILSRISRRGNGIEKMVDKFLMKNMQQKPILTAYGFFPLNKTTLFKIFAAIFTYMVILIQFKDMENTNKKLSTSTDLTTITTMSSYSSVIEK
ncbi:gustatory and pheromone receptor 39a-like isoform X1 [Eupeodes corollae]|uniref:gustatory and pheromone receptor 39a-like isoform X1 n=1 Tax=Eupeodes corollae TaxID=290404 RepID=UPI00249269ED|nr:gustatory and pheromone receptor 39a-like isoform X1 [Eupeodes corollae]